MIKKKNFKEKCFDSKRDFNPKWREFIFSRAALPLTKLLSKTKITPNQVTWMMIPFAIISALFFSKGTVFFGFLGLLFFHLMFLLDWTDGQLARLKNMCSKKGAILDYLVHLITNVIIILGIFMGYNQINNFMYQKALYLLLFFGVFFYLLDAWFQEKIIEKVGPKKQEKGYFGTMGSEFKDLFRIMPFNYFVLFYFIGGLKFTVLFFTFLSAVRLVKRIINFFK